MGFWGFFSVCFGFSDFFKQQIKGLISLLEKEKNR